MTGSRIYFETVAQKWDTMRQGFFSDAVREKAFEAAGAVAGKIAADIGAGSGFVTEGLLRRGLRRRVPHRRGRFPALGRRVG